MAARTKASAKPRVERAPRKAKTEKIPGVADISAETQRVLRARGLTDEEILHLRTSEPASPRAEAFRPAGYQAYLQLYPFVGDADSLAPHRYRMVTWIDAFFSTRAAEADCNLDCGTCPSGQLLLCTAYNDGAARFDGFDLFAAFPTYLTHGP